MVKPDISFVSLQVPSDLIARIEGCINAACGRLTAADTVLVYFRADDIGVPGAKFFRMMELFSNHRIPLSLAVVPAWLTAQRWNALQNPGGRFSSLWCWHQHGWRHINHEYKGRKQEFPAGKDDDPPVVEKQKDNNGHAEDEGLNNGKPVAHIPPHAVDGALMRGVANSLYSCITIGQNRSRCKAIKFTGAAVLMSGSRTCRSPGPGPLVPCTGNLLTE